MGAVAAATLLVLAACGGAQEEGPGGAAGATSPGATGSPGGCQSYEEITIGFPGLPPDFVQMGLPLAIHRGVLEAYCVRGELVATESGIAAFRATMAGEFLFSYSGSVSPILGKGEGADAVVFMSPAHLLDFQVAALPGYESCESLRNQPVATDGPGGLIHAVMEQFLATCGLDIDRDVRVQIGDPETFPAQLASKAVVATALHVDEKLFTEQEIGIDLVELGNSWEYAPLFHYASLSAKRSVLEENRDLFVRISAAILESNRWLVDPANKDRAVAAMAEVSEQPEDVVRQAYETYGTRFPTSCDEALNPEAYEFLIDLQVQLGNLEQPYPVEELVDPSVCQDAEQLVAEREAAGQTVP
ncbi:MAG TPA: ABC transporter substrate-binding protein [Actinomycetota bacterium]|nr:ABC transporter substrate-binding protein [Actinomycetota bacterium]